MLSIRHLLLLELALLFMEWSTSGARPSHLLRVEARNEGIVEASKTSSPLLQSQAKQGQRLVGMHVEIDSFRYFLLPGTRSVFRRC